MDCEFPLDEEATLDNAGANQKGCACFAPSLRQRKFYIPTVWRMKHIFAKDIFNAVAEATLIAKAPSYKTILDLDHKVREISFPAYFKPYITLEEGESEFYSSSLSLRGFYSSQNRTVSEYSYV